jgi:acyl carrier protein
MIMSAGTNASLPAADAAALASVQALLAEVLGLSPAEVVPAAALIDDLGAESIDFLDISFRLEQQYGCALPTVEWAEFLRTNSSLPTVADLAGPPGAPADAAGRAVQRLADGFERIFGVAFPPAAREELVTVAGVDAGSEQFRVATRRILTVDVLARFVARHRTVGEEAPACGT